MTGEAPQEAVSTQGNAANPPNSNSGGDPVASSGTALPYHSRTHAESIQETMNEREAAAPQAKPFDKTKVRNLVRSSIKTYKQAPSPPPHKKSTSCFWQHIQLASPSILRGIIFA